MLDVAHYFQNYKASKGAPAKALLLSQTTPDDHGPGPGIGGVFWRVEKGDVAVVFLETEKMVPEDAMAIFDMLCELEPEQLSAFKTWCDARPFPCKVT